MESLKVFETRVWHNFLPLWPHYDSRAAIRVSQRSLLQMHQRQSWRHLRIKAFSLSLIITLVLTSRSFWAKTWRLGVSVILGSRGWEGTVRLWWRCWMARWILILAANTNSSSFNTEGPVADSSLVRLHWKKSSSKNGQESFEPRGTVSTVKKMCLIFIFLYHKSFKLLSGTFKENVRVQKV